MKSLIFAVSALCLVITAIVITEIKSANKAIVFNKIPSISRTVPVIITQENLHRTIIGVESPAFTNKAPAVIYPNGWDKWSLEISDSLNRIYPNAPRFNRVKTKAEYDQAMQFINSICCRLKEKPSSEFKPGLFEK